MSFHSRLAAIGAGVGVLIVVLGLVIGGWFLGLGLAQRLDRTSATVINLLCALTPAAIVLMMSDRKAPIISIAALAILIVVMIATFNLHAAAWIGPHMRLGSGERLLAVLSALIWPALAAGAFGAAVSRRTGERFNRTGSLLSTVVRVALHVSVLWFMLGLLSRTTPIWLMAVVFVGTSFLLEFVLESEIALLIYRRSSIEVQPSVMNAKLAVEAHTKTPVAGPIVVDLGEALIAEVRWRLFRRPVLIISAAMARLDEAAVTAVIAHEYAHVSLRHLHKRLCLSIGLLLVLVIAVGQVHGSGVDVSARPVVTLVVLSAALICQRLLLYAYARRQEREADDFAAAIAGADAMQAALRLTSRGALIPSSMSVWMTHDSPEARLRVLNRKIP